MKRAILPFLLLALAACTTATVDMNEPRRVVGTENAVRVDAEIFGDDLQNGAHIPITYVITNERPQAIAIADLIPVTTYDAESQMMTVNIGSEVPGQQLVPRLIRIAPGEKKSFNTSARVAFVVPRTTDASRTAPVTELRLKINFLGDTSGGFEQLVDIPERAIADAKLADQLFPLWLERNEALYTNSVPMHWKTGLPDAGDTAARRRRP
ncbi:MAG TPA: hypothetical protein VJZ00_22925 [Thermoanaerobaculia bacterium]|nr:hypothetical protein [Thermoanaerobaculia bacterium]